MAYAFSSCAYFSTNFFRPIARELHRDLGVFAIAFALIHRTFAILWMPNALSGTESSFPARLFHLDLRRVELLPARGKELRNIVDRVVGRSAELFFCDGCCSRPYCGR